MIAQIKKEEVENYWGIKRDDKWVVNKLLPTNRDKMPKWLYKLMGHAFHQSYIIIQASNQWYI